MKIKLLFSLLLIHVFFIANAATPPNASISYNSPFCTNSNLQPVILIGTTGGTFSASPAGLSISTATGDISPSQSTPGTYVVTYDIPAGVDPAFSTTTIVTIGYMTWPNFAQIAPICRGSTPPILPTTSPNGITGTWNPSAINTQIVGTYVYVFTPSLGQCANLQSYAVTVTPDIEPIFTFSSYNFCVGNIPVLPTISTNGITGTWSPPVITTTGTYTFTPNVNQCGTTTTENFFVSPLPNATISGSMTVCEGTSANVTISGTPNSTVTFTVDGINLTINLDSNGIGTLTTPTLSTSTAICLVSVQSWLGVSCTTPLTECCIITVLPYPVTTISTSGVYICEGATAAATFNGTPNAIVAYSINSGFNQTIVLSSGGMATISLPVFTGTTVVDLVSVTTMNGSCTQNILGSVFITTIPMVTISPMPDVTVCNSYTLPALQVGNYFTQPSGAGTMLNAGDIISSTQTVYVFTATLSTPSCSSEDSFQVTVIPAVIPTISTADNINYIIVDGPEMVQTLPLNTDVQIGEYEYQWMESQNEIIGATNPIYTVDTIFGNTRYYSVRITNLLSTCTTESPVFAVYEIPVPAPVGDPNQTFILGQTLADVVVSGSNIRWYDVLNRNAASNPLPLSTVLVEGVTYYATQTINGHESASAFEITIQFLANDTFGFKDLKFSPNPVQDMLHITSKELIKNVVVYNIMGQKILLQNFDSLDLRLQLSQLKTGNYFIKLESDDKSQVIKVVKQ